LGLSLLEAMHLGMPVVALGTTAAPETVPPVAGTVSTRVDDLVDAVRAYVTDRELAHAHGLAARAAALRDHGLDRFLRDWDLLLEEVV
jgi:glycosyltransferase involved in cell wall biosynthesis